MFCILDPRNEDDADYLAQMHHLRYKIFYEKLNWRNGLKVYNQMEFDQYDHEYTKYLVRINSDNRVDACARLTPTNKPYLLGHTFSECVTDITIPSSENIYEISRLCADSKTAPRNITGQLMAAILEFGLANNIQQFVSFSDVRIIPVIRRFGWASVSVGPETDTGTDISAALHYETNTEFYENVKKAIGISTIPDNEMNLPNVIFDKSKQFSLVIQ